jgi:hypothetical protein
MTTTTTTFDWDVRRAATKLGITLVPFDRANFDDPDNVRGYSFGTNMAIRVGEPHPNFIAFHEMAHIVRGHTTGKCDSIASMVGSGGEAEAHGTAILLAKAFDFDSTQWDEAHEFNLLETWRGHSLYARGEDALDSVIVRTAKIIREAGRR